MNKFLSLKHQGRASDDFACALLEQAIKPEVLHEVLLTNTDISIWDDFHTEMLKVSRNLKWLQILRGSAFGYSQCSSGGGAHFSAAGTQPGAGAPMDIGAVCQGQPQKRGNPQCYNCQQYGHIACNCRNAKVPHGQQLAVARVAKILAQLMAGPSNADERVRALQGMDFDMMHAYFLNLKD